MNKSIPSRAENRMAFEVTGLAASENGPTVYWGHGWGQTRGSFLPLVSILDAHARNVRLDLPGFGETARPASAWGTEEYAGAVAEEIEKAGGGRPVVWAGHSFGGRVGIQLAARRPDLISGLILIASAGLQRRRSFAERVKVWFKIRTFKFAKFVWSLLGWDVDQLRAKFGSPDYRSAGEMRDVLVNVVREDLSNVAKKIKCPVLLVYGADDTETPPEIAKRLADLIPNAKLSVLPNHDHYSVLAGGRHVVASRIVTFLESL